MASEAKIKDAKCVEAARQGRENYMKKLKNRLLKDNQMVPITFREFIDYFQQDLYDPASNLITLEEKIRIIGEEEHKTEIDISIGMI